MITGRSLFSGGEGIGVGMRAAGITVLPGIEINPEFASVAEKNGFPTITANIFDVDPQLLEPTDLLHASPECTRASTANENWGESDLDKALARQIVKFIEILKPAIFTLENVIPYRHFESLQIILDALNLAGYWSQKYHLNAADFGVPQTRRRLFIVASKGWAAPIPTHIAWRSWFSALEDMLPNLPNSTLARWIIERLDLKTPQSILFDCMNSSSEARWRQRSKNEPSITITPKGGIKAFILSDDRPISENIQDQITRYEAWLDRGRIITLSPRALARLQSFPDTYEFPKGKHLSRRIIGNAVPPLMYQRLIQPIVDYKKGAL